MFLDTSGEANNTPAILPLQILNLPEKERIYGKFILRIYLEVIIFSQLCSAALLKLPPAFIAYLNFNIF